MRLAPGLLRLKLYLASNGRRVAVVLLVLATVSLGGAGITYANPPTETVTEERHRQTVSTDVETSAVVTGNTSLYERGSRIRSKPVYLLGATPTLTLRIITTLPEGTTAPVTHRLWVTYTARRDGETFWRERRPLDTETARGANGTVVTETQVRMEELRRQRHRIQEEISGAGELSVTLDARSEYDTDRYDGDLSLSSPVSITDRAYWIGGEMADERVHTTTVRKRTVDEERMLTVALPSVGRPTAPHTAVVLGGVGGICFVGAVAIGLFLRGDPDGAALAETLDRTRYAEWISVGRIPPDIGSRTVSVGSLKDLVDVAIDSSKRVINDPDRDLYAVIDEETVYCYDPEDESGTFLWGPSTGTRDER